MFTKLHIQITSLLTALLLFTTTTNAALFTTAQSGDWCDAATWNEPGHPTANDDVIIGAGHVVEITGSAYTYYGDIIIEENSELVVSAGNAIDGLIYCGEEFHVFGKLTFTGNIDFSIIGDSHFWGHPNAEIWITDDWKVSENTITTVESICVRVDDDFHIRGRNAMVCGNGGVSIGGSTSANTFNLYDGAGLDQVCEETTVYRSSGGTGCGTVVEEGKGNTSPTALDDEDVTLADTPITIDILAKGTADNDPENDNLTITSVGTDVMNNEQTEEGGTVTINRNGTLTDPTDDYVDYTPASGFIGVDKFQYIITDGNGGFDKAEVTVTVNAALPVELVHFRGTEGGCQITLSWATAAELNNSHFEVERSVDGYVFEKIGVVNGAGTSEQYNVYDFQDELPVRENYYRLKQVDFDGTTDYSDVIFIASNCLQNEDNIGIVKVFPNPVMTGTVNMKFDANLEENAVMSISDLYGKNIRREVVNIQTGMNNFAVDINDLQAGTYILTIGRQTTKFIKAID